MHERGKGQSHVFSKELQDIQDMQGVKPIVGDFLSFADFFFDGAIADIFVQVKISEAKTGVADFIRRTRELVQRLYEYRREIS